MKHTYIVEGMTCNGCKASVEKSIASLEEVSNVTVDLDAAEVAIEMKNHITLSKLQEALSSKYTISEIKTEKVTAFDSSKEKSEIQQLFPLFLIFGYITIAAIFSAINPWNTSDFMLNFMGLFYIVFSFFKLLDVKGFAMSFGMYDPLSKVIPTYGFVYPFIELALGIFFLMRFQIFVSLAITLIILGITTVGVAKSLLDKKSIQCACLGSVLNLPMTKATFIENSIMILMAILMIFNYL
ncbi:MAG: cation transporter [Polaribacter sp.]|jgi:cation transport ATPase|nr:cation transporter [Polaribacter sp.]